MTDFQTGFAPRLTFLGATERVKIAAAVFRLLMVAVIPPKYAVARIVQSIKSRSAKALKAKFPFLQKVYFSGKGIWSRGYCVSGIGLNEKEILAYVEHQQKEDTGQLQLPF